jgi:hypothetical protein
MLVQIFKSLVFQKQVLYLIYNPIWYKKAGIKYLNSIIESYRISEDIKAEICLGLAWWMLVLQPGDNYWGGEKMSQNMRRYQHHFQT